MSPDPGLPTTTVPSSATGPTSPSTHVAADRWVLVAGRLDTRILEVTPDRRTGDVAGPGPGDGSATDADVARVTELLGPHAGRGVRSGGPGRGRHTGGHRQRPVPGRRDSHADPLLVVRPPPARGGQPSRVDRRSPGRRGCGAGRTDRRRPCRLCRRAGHPDRPGPSRPPPVGRGRGHPRGGQVPPRPSGLVADGGRRPGGGVDGAARSVSTRPDQRSSAASRFGRARVVASKDAMSSRCVHCRHRLRHQLDPPAGGRRFGPPLGRLMRITRLGQGVDATGRLAPEAVERCIAVLREFRSVMDGFGVARGRLVATSAARDAANGADFLAAAGEATGLQPELLTGLEEGRLSMAGAVVDLDPAEGPYLVLDIGGGSTELIAARRPRRPELVAVSLQLGCVRLSERILDHDPPTPEELAGPGPKSTAQLDRRRGRSSELPGRPPTHRAGRDGHDARFTPAGHGRIRPGQRSTTPCCGRPTWRAGSGGWRQRPASARLGTSGHGAGPRGRDRRGRHRFCTRSWTASGSTSAWCRRRTSSTA